MCLCVDWPFLCCKDTKSHSVCQEVVKAFGKSLTSINSTQLSVGAIKAIFYDTRRDRPMCPLNAVCGSIIRNSVRGDAVCAVGLTHRSVPTRNT